jgi:hypothetical protein
MMATAGVAPASGLIDVNASSVSAADKLPDEILGMKIKDDKVNIKYKKKCLFLSFSCTILSY